MRNLRKSPSNRFKIFLIFRVSRFLFILFLLYSCQSVEFIPDIVYREDLIRTHKQSWKEIEILKEAPRRREYEVYGRILIRNFGDGKTDKYYYDQIRKELFDRGMDGMFLAAKGIVSMPPTLFQSGTANGYSANFAELPQEARVLEGIAFRYKEPDSDGKTSR
ncbi:putative lipoprotein [Leptospira fainei serovar Hurstbridge str. BUT 6]|uniref:Lipoprotein n=1 Tax=Leptospira fainei serovar Hurstbridge str. BUT 6 TaxID=1193011 RepID=S3UX24_9LEPT|nr:putative lipoprotein [Leptospira fainei serovar Hurstbridge str. BUT 6]